MSKCKEHKCDGYIWTHGKHTCEPLWEIACIDEYDGTEDCWMEQRGSDEEDAVENMCSGDGEFCDGQEEYIVRSPKTKKEVKVSIIAEPTICYSTRMEEFEGLETPEDK